MAKASLLLIICLVLGGVASLDDTLQSPTAPDGGSREGNVTQFTPTLTTIAAKCRSWLDVQFNTGNASDGKPYGFTQPSLWKYSKSQWLWDSGAAAIANAWHNPNRSILELDSLLRAQTSDGRIPEMVSWPSMDGDPKTQMPVLPWTLQRIYNQTADIGVLERYVPPLIRYWNWWQQVRDVDRDGLVTILHPWESGLDISPCYDKAWHVHNPRPPAVAYSVIYPLLDELQLVYKTKYNWNETAILARSKAEPSLLANWFMVKDVGVNTLYAVGWAVLGDMATLYGDYNTAQMCHENNIAAENAIHEKMWKPSLGAFVTMYKDRDGSAQYSDTQGAQTMWPLMLRSLTEVQRAALVADIQNPKKFWTKFPFPSVSASAPEYSPKYTVNLMWRGPSWGFTNWFILEALDAVGEHELVLESVQRWANAYRAATGVWEMWNPDTGIGYGAEGLGMSSLILDWLHRTDLLNETNVPTPPNKPALKSALIGGSKYGSVFDDSWWYNATGVNSVIDTIVLHGTNSSVCGISVTYGDSRAPQLTPDMHYEVLHGSIEGSSLRLDIPRGVKITKVTICGNDENVHFVNVSLASDVYTALGSSTIGSCKTFTETSSSSTLSGWFGREVKSIDLKALGVYWSQ